MNQFQLIVLLEVLAYTMQPNQAYPVQLCGTDLYDTLKSICAERGYYSPPAQVYSRRAPARVGIATRCCQSMCDPSILETYCNPRATSESQTAAAPSRTSSAIDERRANEVVVDYSDQIGNDGSQMSRLDGVQGREIVTNRSKLPSTELLNEESYDNEDGAAEGKTDEGSPSERGESIQDDDEANRQEPNNTRGNSKERGKNRTSKGLSSERRVGNNRRKGLSSERRVTISSRKEARLRRKEQRHRERELRKQSNAKRKSKGEKKDTTVDVSVTTPIAVEAARLPLKNGGNNSTSGDLSLVNATDSDTASSSEAKKDDLITTITAVLRDVIGFQQTDDGNR